MFKIDRKGCTRTVILTKRYAFKFPTFQSYKLFLYGLLANLEEKVWTTQSFPDINNSYYNNSLGLLVIQKRVRPVIHRGLFWLDHKRILVTSVFPAIHERDVKPENYGYNELNNLVKIDLG